MSSVNIPSSLNTTTQIPVVSKTYKLLLSDITNVTTEQAFTYYAGMRVDVAENNKQYIWKEVVVGATPISNIYQYPANHIAGGYDYSNKSFAFYEVIVESENPGPVEDNRIIYKTEVYNVPYTGIPSMTNETFSPLYSQGSFDEPDEDNVQLSRYGISPISSNTLRVFRSPASIHNPSGMTVPVRIEMYPELPNAAIVGEGGQYGGIDAAIDDGHQNIVVLPGTDLNDVRVGDHIPGLNLMLAPGVHFTDRSDLGNLLSSGDSSLIVPRNAILETYAPIANINQSANLEIRGEGVIVARSTSLINATNINNVVGASIAKSLVNIKISGVNIEMRDAQLAEVSNNVSLVIDNANLTSYNNTSNLIETSGANVYISNSRVHAENSNISNVISVSDSSTIDLRNVDTSGTFNNLVNVGEGITSSLDIKVNNIDVTDTVFTNIVGTDGSSTKIDFDKISINNIVKDNTGDITNIEDVIINNVSNTTTPSVVTTNIPLFKNKQDANVELPPYSLFINQNDSPNDEDWVLDFTV